MAGQDGPAGTGQEGTTVPGQEDTVGSEALEAGDDAVRVLTVHGSKGLEFPITIVCGFNSPPGGRRRGVQVSFGAGRKRLMLRMRDGLEQRGLRRQPRH